MILDVCDLAPVEDHYDLKESTSFALVSNSTIKKLRAF